LALDISTLSAIAGGHFASSHERLGRNRPENGFREIHLNNDFFSKVVGSRGTLIDWKPMKVSTSSVCNNIHTVTVLLNYECNIFRWM